MNVVQVQKPAPGYAIRASPLRRTLQCLSGPCHDPERGTNLAYRRGSPIPGAPKIGSVFVTSHGALCHGRLMLTPNEQSIDPTGSTVTPRDDRSLILELDLEHELESAIDEIAAGDFIELSPEDLEGWGQPTTA